MKKSLRYSISAITFSLFIAFSASAQDVWTPSENNGFVDNFNYDVKCLQVFKGNLYAGCGDDKGSVNRTSTGNIGSWASVLSDSAIYGMDALTSTTDGGGFIYAASYAWGSDEPRIYRSADGVTWNKYYATPNRIFAMVPYKGLGTVDTIYEIERAGMGDIIKRSAYDSNDPYDTLGMWDTVLDFAPLAAYTEIKSALNYNGKIYIGTNYGATLWSTSNGTIWSQNLFVGSGFGDASNSEISALGSYGGYVYAGTYNYSGGGAQLWRSNDDSTWTMVYSNSAAKQIAAITTVGTELWISWVNANTGPGGGIERSTDGLVFSISENNGFGDSNNQGTYGNFATFGNNLYFASENYGYAPVAHPVGGGHGMGYSTGAQIWRLCLLTHPTIAATSDQTICDGATATFTAAGGFSSYYWSNGSSTSTTSATTAGDYYLYATDANGCDALDTVHLSVQTSPTITVTTPNLMAYTMCLGGSLSTVDTALSNLEIPLPSVSRMVNDSIFDYWTIEDTINISGINGFASASASILSVTLDSLYHGNDADLLIQLFAPDSSNINLTYYNGFGVSNFIGTNFTASASTTLYSAPAPYTGTYLPDGSFSTFTGSANGNWRLRVYDNYPGNIGVLKGWSIKMKVADTILTYSWTPTTGIANPTSLNTTITPAGSTIYTLTATNSIGCPSSISDTLTVPQIDIPLTHDTICYGASAVITASGGNTYYWSPSTGLSSTTGNTVTANPTSPIEYYVMDTIMGCVVTDSIHVYVNGQLFLTPPASTMVCYNDSLSLTSVASGGTSPYTFSWYDGASTLTGATIYKPYTTALTYTVTVADAYGCALNSTTDIGVTPSTDIYGHVAYSGGNVSSSSIVLYKYEPYLMHFDTTQISTTDASGNYHFASVDHHQYLIEVFPSATFTTLVPTYYGDKFVWDSATVISHDCAMNDTLNINAVEEITVAGPGDLGGRIVEGLGYVRSPGDPVPGIDVKLGRNPGGQMVTHTTTNTNGEYAFAGIALNIPGEHYTVYVDIPGLARDSSYSVVLDAAHVTYDSLNYLVDSTTIYIVPTSSTGITNVNTPSTNFTVFPNPSKGDATVEYSINGEATVSLGVYNVLGVKIVDLVNTKQSAGNYKYTINAKNNSLAAGVYYITLITNGKTNIHKIVITE